MGSSSSSRKRKASELEPSVSAGYFWAAVVKAVGALPPAAKCCLSHACYVCVERKTSCCVGSRSVCLLVCPADQT